MGRDSIRNKMTKLTKREIEYRNGYNDFSDIPFATRKINGEDVLYIPLPALFHYKKGPLFNIKKHSRFQAFPAHCHDGIEINYMYSGCCHQIVNGKEITLSQGQTLILNKDTIHKILPLDEPDVLLNININPHFLITNFLSRFSCDSILTRFFVDAVTDSIQQDTYIFFESQNSNHLPDYFEHLLSEWYTPSIVFQDVAESLLSLIVSELVIVYKDVYTNSNLQLSGTPILPILRYVEENFLTCTLQETADIFNLNPNYMSNLLKKHTGFSYRQLVQHQKLTTSEQLLRSTSLSVSEIAHMAGYENVTFFYKKFSEKNSCLPNEYRQAYRK